MNKVDHVVQLTYRFAQQIEAGLPLPEIKRRWKCINRIIKRYWRLESAKRAPENYMIDKAVADITSLKDLSLTIEYYSDRWCRGRMWVITKAIDKLNNTAI